MELYFKDSGLLVAEGESQEQLEARPEYDPTVHGISDTGQTWHPARVPRREVWFYIKSENKYYLSTRTKHSIVSAAEEKIGAARWAEIEDEIEDVCPLGELLAVRDLVKFKRKVERAFDKGNITFAEVLSIKALVNGGK